MRGAQPSSSRRTIASSSGASAERVLRVGSVVAAREYGSQADALVRSNREFGDLASATDGLDGTTLPASYEVGLRTGPRMEERPDALGATLRQTAGVADVRY